MNTLEFLKRVLPADHVHIIAAIGTGQPKQYAVGALEAMASEILERDSSGVTGIYHACASYHDGTLAHRLRGRENVARLKSFWLDCDYGPTHKGVHYENQEQATADIEQFVMQCGLPRPLVVDSGFGFHLYWPLTEPILPDRWDATALRLKALTTALKTKFDPARTADRVSILRTPGTYNRKNPRDPRPVRVLADGPDSDPADFERRVSGATRQHGVKVTERPSNAGINAGAGAGIERPNTADANVIAKHCAQMAKVKDARGDVGEPLWYAAIQVLARCRDGDATAQEWSSGHPNYSHAETAAKLEHARDATTGAATCAQFEGLNAPGCVNCPFKGTINSPITLGQIVVAAERVVIKYEDTEITLPDPPYPYVRGDGTNPGIFMKDDSDIPRMIYPYDFFPFEITKDNSVEFVRFKHQGCAQIPEEITITSATLHDPKALWIELINQQVQIQGPDKTSMLRYMENYIANLRKEAKLRTMHESAGWKDGGNFLLGDMLYTRAGPIKSGLSKNARKLLHEMHPIGDKQAWIERTAELNRDGHEQWCFPVMLSLGAPISEFQDLGSLVTNGYSDATGTGKTTSLRWASSVWGGWDKNSNSAAHSTENAHEASLGVLRNLPYFIDEVTDMDAKQLSKTIYSVAGGVGKRRLNRNSDLKEVGDWSTVVMVTANRRLFDKLSAEHADTSARGARIMEYEFVKVPGWDGRATKEFLDDNHGLIAGAYIQRLVDIGPDELKRLSRLTAGALSEELHTTSEDRFWVGHLANSILGTQIARDDGLVMIDPYRMVPWMGRLCGSMKDDIRDVRPSAASLIADFVNAHARSMVVSVMHGSGAKKVELVENAGHSDKLLIRVEKGPDFMYIDQKAIRAWLSLRQHTPRIVQRELEESGIMVCDDAKKVLGAGLAGYAPASSAHQTWCWKINLRHVDMEIPDGNA